MSWINLTSKLSVIDKLIYQTILVLTRGGKQAPAPFRPAVQKSAKMGQGGCSLGCGPKTLACPAKKWGRGGESMRALHPQNLKTAKIIINSRKTGMPGGPGLFCHP